MRMQSFLEWKLQNRERVGKITLTMDDKQFEDLHPRKEAGKFEEKPETTAFKEEYGIIKGFEEKGEENEPDKEDKDGRRKRALDDFEAVCRRSSEVPERVRKQYRAGDASLSPREYDGIAKALGEWLVASDGVDGDRRGWTLKNPKTGDDVHVNKVDGDVFRKLFACCRTYLKNGDQVDLHDEDYYRDGGFGIVSDNGMSGLYITKDGDAVSVYSLSAKDEDGKRVRGGGFFKTIAPLMRKYAKTTDCFKTKNQNLPEFYKAVFGFKEASVLPFDRKIMEQFNGKEYTDWFVKTYGESPVSFMVMTDEYVETRHFTDWDDAHDYQTEVANRTARPSDSGFSEDEALFCITDSSSCIGRNRESPRTFREWQNQKRKSGGKIRATMDD